MLPGSSRPCTSRTLGRAVPSLSATPDTRGMSPYQPSSGAIASGSSFRGATVTDADFSDALIDRVDQRSLCRDAEGTNPITGVDTRLSLGC